jgi:RimJ/RimL family protein N-acetyltransferase
MAVVTTPGPTFPDVTPVAGDLVLRPVHEMDAAPVAEYCVDPVTQTWLPLPDPYTLDHARWFCATFAPAQQRSGQGIVRAIELDGRLAGMIDLKRTDWRARTTEVGYWAAPWARGRGVMTRAVSLLVRWALLEQGFERVELRAATGNLASQRVAEKAGFQREGVARNAGFVHAGRVDLVVYSLVPADLPSTPWRS